MNIAIIGCGNRGLGLGKALVKYKKVRITAAADPDAARAAALGRELGICPEACVTDYKKILRMPDVQSVMVLSPDHTHHEIVCAAAKAKKHIFCEKPMALCHAHCVEMEKTAVKNKVMLMMGFCLRYNNLYRTARDLVSKGVIGNIKIAYAIDSVERGGAYFFHSWHRLKSQSGGLLYQKATHSLDILNWLIDSPPVSVYALSALDVFGGNEPNTKHCSSCSKKKTCPEYIDSHGYHSDYLDGKPFVIENKCAFAKEIDITDNSQLLIRYKNGAKVSFTEIHFTPDYKREFFLIGTLGRMTIHDFYLHNKNQNLKPWCSIEISYRHSGKITLIKPKLQKGGHGGGDTGMLDDFVDSLCGRRKPLADGRTGTMSSAIVDAAERSIDSGNAEKIK